MLFFETEECQMWKCMKWKQSGRKQSIGAVNKKPYVISMPCNEPALMVVVKDEVVVF